LLDGFDKFYAGVWFAHFSYAERMRILLGRGDDIPAQTMPELFSSDVAAEGVPAVAALVAAFLATL
jgi:hypothetical protein